MFSTMAYGDQYSETNVMHFLFSLLRIKGLYMFGALLAHPQKALHKRHLVYCVRVMSDGCSRIGAPLQSFNVLIKSLRATLPAEIFLLRILIFKGLTARHLYKSFGVKVLKCLVPHQSACLWTTDKIFVFLSPFTGADVCCTFVHYKQINVKRSYAAAEVCRRFARPFLVHATLKGRRFQTTEEIQENAIRELRAIAENAFQEAFLQWKNVGNGVSPVEGLL
jgi:hypothetical protein